MYEHASLDGICTLISQHVPHNDQVHYILFPAGRKDSISFFLSSYHKTNCIFFSSVQMVTSSYVVCNIHTCGSVMTLFESFYFEPV